MAFLLLITATLVAVLLSPIATSFINYQKARKIGLPIIYSPVGMQSTVWTLAGMQLGPIFARLPLGLGSWTRYTGFRAFFTDKFQLHEQYGPAFIIVTPSEVQVVVADAEGVNDILMRRGDFPQPAGMYQPLEIFGPNVDTTDGEAWQRHRRLTTPPFNERNSKLVWKESTTQAAGMLRSWLTASRKGINQVKADTMTLALHVLTSAGLGKTYAFDGGLTKLANCHTLSYKDSLRIVLANLFTTIFLISTGIPTFFLPRNAIEVKNAIVEFKKYMVEMVEEEKSTIGNRDPGKDNLLSALVRAAQGDKSSRNSLTDEEIYGNLFIYNFAGHDTTAGVLAYAIHLLAINPKLQDWIREELDHVFGREKEIEEDEYEALYPKMKRCLAVMYESLRLYGPVILIPRHTGSTPSTLNISNKEYTFPPDTYVTLSIIALNTWPRYWGPDALVWKPERWIIPGNPASPLESEELLQPAPGVYIPWSSGPRVCPGKKFAQVEFVAVMAKLFRKHRVVPLVEEGETMNDAMRRVQTSVDDSKLEITLQMKNPESIRLMWDEVI